MEDKKAIRKHILNKRDGLTEADRAQWDKDIFQKFISSNHYKNAKNIFIFVSFKSEVNTREIIKKAFKDGKRISVPKVISKEEGMKAYVIKGFQDLELSNYGILEPKDTCMEMDVNKIDLVVMPGAAFDNKGGRIGYGGGYYDRFLPKIRKNVKKIALAYKMQLIPIVPMDERDIRVDEIITN